MSKKKRVNKHPWNNPTVTVPSIGLLSPHLVQLQDPGEVEEEAREVECLVCHRKEEAERKTNLSKNL